ncbi:PP2C family protein-serine/threonine phosphatase [Salinactinospora qingdaonensis]|uniref:PP2C family protein-serine/threonine phosphatase n=1 Tax=Salinactinospora qingdaonensis TaxID=702744 RepID=A0ABP7GKN2_9ACTN
METTGTTSTKRGKEATTGTLDAAIDGVDEAVVICDRTATVQSVHGTARQLVPEIAPGDDIAQSPLAPLARPERQTRQHRLRHNGLDLSAKSKPLRDGGFACYVTETASAPWTGRRRAEFLGEATKLLNASLRVERVIRTAVQLPVPRLAAACCYAAIAPDGSARWWNWYPTGQRGEEVTTGEWDSATVSGMGWLSASTLAEPRAFEPWPGDIDGILDDILPAEAPRPGALLAVPVRAVSGVVGVLLFIRTTGQAPFDEDETDVLREFANRAATAIGSATLYQYQAHTAAILKSGLVPAPLPHPADISLGAAYRCAHEADRIGGDYYEVTETTEGLGFLLGDVCGKGAEAAVLTGLVRQSIHALRRVQPCPVQLLRLLNDVLMETIPEKFTTLILGRAERNSAGGLDLELASGGHPCPLILHRDGTVTDVVLRGMFVGALRQAVFDSVALTLAPGETLLLYSDGVTEARRGVLNGEMFGEERLRDLLAECAGLPAEATAARLEQAIGDWLGGNRHDDIAILALQPRLSRPEEGR